MHRCVRPLGVLAALVVGPAMLAACSFGSHDTSASDSASAKAAALALPKGVSNAKDVPNAVANDSSLRKNVALTACGQIDGGWQAAGTATNHEDTPADYAITVFFTTPHDTVIGTGNAHVHIGADSTAKWTVAGKFAAADGTECVLRGVG